MTTQTAEKIYKELRTLREETNALKELVFLIARDPEGGYRDSFVKRIMKKVRLKPHYSFHNRKEFFKQIV